MGTADKRHWVEIKMTGHYLWFSRSDQPWSIDPQLLVVSEGRLKLTLWQSLQVVAEMVMYWARNVNWNWFPEKCGLK